MLAVGPAWEPAPETQFLRSSTQPGAAQRRELFLFTAPPQLCWPSSPLDCGGTSPVPVGGRYGSNTGGAGSAPGVAWGQARHRVCGGAPTQPADSGVSQEGSGRGPSCTRTLGRRVGRRHPASPGAACHSWGALESLQALLDGALWTARPGACLACPPATVHGGFPLGAGPPPPAPSAPVWSAPVGSLVGLGVSRSCHWAWAHPACFPAGTTGSAESRCQLSKEGAQSCARVLRPVRGALLSRLPGPLLRASGGSPWTRSTGRAASPGT